MEILWAAIILGGLGLILGLGLAIAAKVFYVKVDTRVEDITGMLPNANCGACGNPGCKGMAESLLAGESKLTQCKPGTQEMREQIAEYISTHPNEDGEITKVKW